jgi:hypothetical protein
MPVKITTTAALICGSLFFLTTHGQAEEHYIYKDPQGGLVISNQKPPAGSNVLRTLDLPAFREPQLQQVQQSESTRSTGTLESSPKQEQKK